MAELKDKKFVCDKCPYKTAFSGDLKAHVKARHDKIKEYGCDKCGNFFALNSK